MGGTGKGGSPDAATRWSVVEEACQALLAKAARPSRESSINAVWNAIGHLRKSDVEITMAAVARFCKATAKVPKAQSIRNDVDGLDRLVSLAAACQASSKRSGATAPKGDLADRIADPQSAAEVRILRAERDALKRRLEAQASAFRRVEPLGRITAEMATEKVETLGELRDRIMARPGGGLAFDVADGEATVELVRSLDELGFAFGEASGELFRPNGLRAVRGDVRAVLQRIMAATLPGGVPDDLPQEFRDVTPGRAA